MHLTVGLTRDVHEIYSPADIPETMTKMINGASDMLTGHKTRRAKPLLIIAKIKALTGPI